MLHNEGYSFNSSGPDGHSDTDDEIPEELDVEDDKEILDAEIQSITKDDVGELNIENIMNSPKLNENDE